MSERNNAFIDETAIGLINIFYYVLASVAFLEQLLTGGVQEALTLIPPTILGVVNLVMMFAPVYFALYEEDSLLIRAGAIIAALYVCTSIFFITPNLNRLYGYYVWCFSFVILAFALNYTTSRLSKPSIRKQTV